MSWYWLRVAPKRELVAAYARGDRVLAVSAWRRVDLIASTKLISSLHELAMRELRGKWAAGGVVGEGTCGEVLEVIQHAYEAADEPDRAAQLAELLITQFGLEEELAIDFYEPAIHPGLEIGWSEPFD